MTAAAPASASKKAIALAELSPYITQLDAKLATFPTILAFEQVLRVKRTPMVAGIYLVSCVSGKSLYLHMHTTYVCYVHINSSFIF